MELWYDSKNQSLIQNMPSPFLFFHTVLCASNQFSSIWFFLSSPQNKDNYLHCHFSFLSIILSFSKGGTLSTIYHGNPSIFACKHFPCSFFTPVWDSDLCVILYVTTDLCLDIEGLPSILKLKIMLHWMPLYIVCLHFSEVYLQSKFLELKLLGSGINWHVLLAIDKLLTCQFATFCHPLLHNKLSQIVDS